MKTYKERMIERILEELAKSEKQKAEWEENQKWNFSHPNLADKRQVDSEFVRWNILERISSLENRLERLRNK